jgi:hypothetical protein
MELLLTLNRAYSKHYWNNWRTAGKLFYDFIVYGYTKGIENVDSDNDSRKSAIFCSQYVMLKDLLNGNKFENPDILVAYNADKMDLIIFIIKNEELKMICRDEEQLFKTIYYISGVCYRADESNGYTTELINKNNYSVALSILKHVSYI